jgi:hypothetical protein
LLKGVIKILLQFDSEYWTIPVEWCIWKTFSYNRFFYRWNKWFSFWRF